MRPKIVFFDLEGTLLEAHYKLKCEGLPLKRDEIAESAWQLLSKALGEKAHAEELITQDKQKDGEYTGYVEWMEDTISIHKRHGLSRDVFCQVMDSVPLMAGASKLFETLHSWGVVTAVVSGGFKYLADRVQNELKINHSFAACEYFFNSESGSLEHWNLLPSDQYGKVDFMKIIMKEYGVSPFECAFVGDSNNDIPIAREVGTSIAFIPEENTEKLSALLEATTFQIVQPRKDRDLAVVLKHIDDLGKNNPRVQNVFINPKFKSHGANISAEKAALLWKHALWAREAAYAPYSGNFNVGAAVLTKSGHIFSGCNVENASFGATNCAERTAVFKSVALGHRDISAVCVVADTEHPIPPCGICRQVIVEFGDDVDVIMGNTKGELSAFPIKDLIPSSFEFPGTGERS